MQNDKPLAMAEQISRAVLQQPGLAKLLALSCQWRVLVVYRSGCVGALAIWHRLASAFARWSGLKLLELAEGYIGPASPECKTAPLSMVVEWGQTSRLETLLRASHTPAQLERARNLVALWRTHQLSRYNHARDYQGKLPSPYVLLVDGGDVDAEGFQRMLEAALQENPGCHVVLMADFKPHSGKNPHQGRYAQYSGQARVVVLDEAVHTATLVKQSQALYCHASYIGFEGLLWGKRVRCFGMPFYAGRGLTEDALPVPEGRKPVPLENMVYAVLVAYSYYVDPETLQLCGPERLMAWVGWQRLMRGRFPAVVYAYGFSNYKKPIVRRFFLGSQVLFDYPMGLLPAQSTLVLWGRKALANVAGEKVAENQWHVIRLEDGFIRSVGLGADLIQPLSWALDTRGIYYDATNPSDLEHLLQNHLFDIALLDRARQLRTRLVAAGLTKYNVGTDVWQRPGHITADQVILVPGQVESDASLAFGAPGIRTNADLLMAVRKANPASYILYKPHPDVVAGLRSKGQGEEDAGQWCDEIVVDVAMGALLGQVGSVHTLTSLTGFEALLRGKKVVCYGLPFYAGWGLTEDILPVARRTRRLALDELVAGTLILYPTYISRTTGQFTTPERALDELLIWREKSPILPFWRKLLRGYLKIEMMLKSKFHNTL